jgi:nicotinate-nucleotide--dimethylbenzimidazole phosphoribosyltransferase
VALTLVDIWRHLDGLTKPPRSLGRLEELAARLCQIQQTLAPKTTPRRLVLFAADHGVAAAGVTAWPMSVTGLMVRNMCSGGAASTVLARQAGVDTVLVNVGTIEEPIADPSPVTALKYRSSRVCAGTRNLAEEPALTCDELHRAWKIGAEEAASAARDGMRLVIAGEMGIGNTTSAACLAMLLADVPLMEAVGRGAGADDATLARKRAVVEQAVLRARAMRSNDPLAAIASVAGLELAAMGGFFAAAQAAGLTILLDGYVASAAALIAQQRSPQAVEAMVAAHLSAEPGHARVLRQLGLSAFLDWNMRLGEGTGALALLPLVDATAAIVGEMATLESFGIQTKGAQ